MADITLNRSHNFGIDVGKDKLGRLVEKFKTSNPGQIDKIDWNADKTGANAEGKFFRGQFAVTASGLSVELELKGFAAKMAKGMVQQRLEKTVGEEFPV